MQYRLRDSQQPWCPVSSHQGRWLLPLEETGIDTVRLEVSVPSPQGNESQCKASWITAEFMSEGLFGITLLPWLAPGPGDYITVVRLGGSDLTILMRLRLADAGPSYTTGPSVEAEAPDVQGVAVTSKPDELPPPEKEVRQEHAAVVESEPALTSSNRQVVMGIVQAAPGPETGARGQSSVRFCSECGASRREGRRFCESCGAPFAPSYVPPAEEAADDSIEMGLPERGAEVEEPSAPIFEPTEPEIVTEAQELALTSAPDQPELKNEVNLEPVTDAQEVAVASAPEQPEPQRGVSLRAVRRARGQRYPRITADMTEMGPQPGLAPEALASTAGQPQAENDVSQEPVAVVGPESPQPEILAGPELAPDAQAESECEVSQEAVAAVEPPDIQEVGVTSPLDDQPQPANEVCLEPVVVAKPEPAPTSSNRQVVTGGMVSDCVLLPLQAAPNPEPEARSSHSSVRFCCECGSSMREGRRFCESCGAPFAPSCAPPAEDAADSIEMGLPERGAEVEEPSAPTPRPILASEISTGPDTITVAHEVAVASAPVQLEPRREVSLKAVRRAQGQRYLGGTADMTEIGQQPGLPEVAAESEIATVTEGLTLASTDGQSQPENDVSLEPVAVAGPAEVELAPDVHPEPECEVSEEAVAAVGPLSPQPEILAEPEIDPGIQEVASDDQREPECEIGQGLVTGVVSDCVFLPLQAAPSPEPGAWSIHSIARFCCECGASMPEGRRFCESCGAPFAPSTVPPGEDVADDIKMGLSERGVEVKEPVPGPAEIEVSLEPVAEGAKSVPACDSNREWSEMLGRQDVVARLTDLCARIIADGSGVSCLVNAASGQGRSVVLREVVAGLRSRGINVVLAVPQSGDPLPLRVAYAFLGGDLDRLATRLRHGGPGAAARLLREALERCAVPTILVADDFPRMGETTERVLRALASLDPPAGKGWLLSFPAGGSLTLCPGVECVELPALEADKILFLAQKVLAGPIEEGLQQWLLVKAEASPRRLRLYLHALRSHSSIVRCNGLWKWADGVVPPTDYLGPMLLALTISQLRLLRAACLLDEPFPIEVAIRAAGMAEDEADRNVDRLCRAGVLEESWGPAGQHFQLASPEIKESVLRGLPGRTKILLHSDIVAAMGEGATVMQRGPHEAQAQLSPESLAHLIEGAEQLDQWGAFSEAARLWTLAQDLVHPLELHEWRWRIEAGAVESLWRCGQIEEALWPRSSKVIAARPPTSGEELGHYHNVVGLLARLGWLKGKPAEETLKHCNQLADQVGRDNLWLTLTQGEALEALGKRSEALRALNALAAENGKSLPAQYSLLRGRLLRNLHCFDDSLAVVETALSRPDELSIDEFYALRWELAECQLGLGDLTAALSAVDDSIGFCLSGQDLAWETRFRELRGRCREENEATRSSREPAAGDDVSATEGLEETLDPEPVQSALIDRPTSPCDPFHAPARAKEADFQPGTCETSGPARTLEENGVSEVALLSEVDRISDQELPEAACPLQPGAVFDETAATPSESSSMRETHPRPRRVRNFLIAALALALAGYALKGQTSPISSPVAAVRSAPTSLPLPVLSPTPTPASDYLNPQDGSVLVSVPAGEFLMGDPASTRQVSAYQISKYEVTNAQYARFVKSSGYGGGNSEWQQYASQWGERAPVVCVSWDDADAYCRWAGLRLPTEAEWERASRGTDGRIYPWGNEWDPAKAVYKTAGTDGAKEVGSKPEGISPAGCLDMAGNVWEWTNDWYDSAQTYKVIRGGCWGYVNPVYFRCSFRIIGPPFDRVNCDDGVGFRCARTPTGVHVTLKPTAIVLPRPAPDRKAEVPRLVQRGMDQVLLGKHAEAVPPLQQALAVDSNNGEAHYWLMRAYQKLGEDSKSVAQARMVAKLLPSTTHADEAQDLIDRPSSTTTPAPYHPRNRPKAITPQSPAYPTSTSKRPTKTKQEPLIRPSAPTPPVAQVKPVPCSDLVVVSTVFTSAYHNAVNIEVSLVNPRQAPSREGTLELILQPTSHASDAFDESRPLSTLQPGEGRTFTFVTHFYGDASDWRMSRVGEITIGGQAVWRMRTVLLTR